MLRDGENSESNYMWGEFISMWILFRAAKTVFKKSVMIIFIRSSS